MITMLNQIMQLRNTVQPHQLKHVNNKNFEAMEYML